MVELPLVVARLDGREDVLTVQAYLVDEDFLFLFGKQTLELWDFKIDSKRKVQEKNIDGKRKEFMMVDTMENHY